MYNATLTYVINSNNEIKRLKLESESLYYVDKYTSEFKNEEDFIKHYHNNALIYNFIRENNNTKGKLVVSYTKNMKEKEDITPLFGSNEEFEFKDDPYVGKITEVEKARKLLFNSKNQLFARLIIANKTLEKELNKLLNLSYEEAKFLSSFGFSPITINGKNYISFKSLFEYRIKTVKLGFLRNAYQDMLKTLKEKIMELDSTTFYFYSRQLRIMIDKYYELIGNLSVKNLKIKKVNYNCSFVLIKNNFK